MVVLDSLIIIKLRRQRAKNASECEFSMSAALLPIKSVEAKLIKMTKNKNVILKNLLDFILGSEIKTAKGIATFIT